MIEKRKDENRKNGNLREDIIKIIVGVLVSLIGAGAVITIIIEHLEINIGTKTTEINQTVVGNDIDTARGMCASGEYDSAIAIYERLLEQSPEDKEIFVNLGYAYAHKSAAENSDVYLEKAVDTYKKSACTEGARNLLALLLQNGQTEKAAALIEKLLELDDEITIHFLNKTLVKTSVMDRKDITEENSQNILEALCEFVDSKRYYDGYSAPNDTYETHYEFEKINWNKLDNGSSTPFLTYKVYERRFVANIPELEYVYYTVGDSLRPVK